MTDFEIYRILRNRICSLMSLIEKEKRLGATKYELEKIQELLDVNLKVFAMIFNRNYDTKLDYDPEIQ